MEVKQVDVPSVQGAFGILPKHVPAIATLSPGVLTVFEESDVKKFFGGSLAFISNLMGWEVTLLMSHIHLLL